MSRIARVIVADPPWKFGDPLPGKTRGADKQYKTLSLSDIQRFPLPDIADEAILFLWRVSSQVEEAYDVVRAWGFVPKTELVWIKTTGTVPPEGEDEKLHFGMGHYTRAAHESCVIATRGSFKVADRSIRSVFAAPVGKHSEKPQAFFDLVETLCGAKGTQNGDAPDDGGPFIELFARVPRPGWHTFGDEILPTGYAWTPKTGDAGGGLMVNGKTVALPPGTDIGAVPASVFAAAIGGAVIAPGVVQGPPLPEEGPSVGIADTGKHPTGGEWDRIAALARMHQEEPEPGEPPLPEDAPRLVLGSATRDRGPLPAHVTADLGTHPAVIDETNRIIYVRQAVRDRILSEEDAANPAEAWIKLQYRAPAGFFAYKQPSAGEVFPTLSELAGELRRKGSPVHLVTLAGWSRIRHDVLRAWLVQGGERPDFLERELTTNPTAAAPESHRTRIPAGTDSILPDEASSTVVENMSSELAAVVEAGAVEGAKPKRGRPKKADRPQSEGASAVSILSQGWDTAIARAKGHEGDDGATP